jgi:hypothetical protein
MQASPFADSPRVLDDFAGRTPVESVFKDAEVPTIRPAHQREQLPRTNVPQLRHLQISQNLDAAPRFWEKLNRCGCSA